MGTDPTLEFLSRLSDDSLWEVRRNIPVFEPHTRGEVTVTRDDLQEIADNSNRLLTERGVPGRLTDRHTIRVRADKSGMEPVPNAVVVGFQVNYRVGTYGPEQRPCILADWKLYPDEAGKVDRSPHRSVEYQPILKLIRGAAVMVNDPYLDMGIVANSRDEIYCYSMGAAMGPADANLPKEEPKKEPGTEKPEEPKHTPEEEKLFEKCMSYCRMKYGLDESWPAAKKEEAKPKEKPGEKKPEPEKGTVTPMSTTQETTLYSELQAQIKGLQAEREQECCQTLLYSLEQEGYNLSAEEKTKELNKLVKLDATERPDRVKELRAIYANRRIPLGKIEVYQGHVEGGTNRNENNPFATPWWYDDAMAYMLEHPGMGWEASVAEIKKQAGKK